MGQALRTLPLLLLVSACVLPYQPSRLSLVPGDDAFDRILYLLRDDYPALVEVDRENFRIQSRWISCEDRGVPAQRRLNLFMDGPGDLSVLVEVRYLRVGIFGDPSWTSARGHRPWETELLLRIEEAFAPPIRDAGGPGLSRADAESD